MEADRLQRARALLTPALIIHTDLLIRTARGVHVEDEHGRRYMDFTSGLATVNTGHNHPKVVAAIQKQAESLLHGGCIFHHEPLLDLAEVLSRVTPPGLDRFFFSNSGAEAVEGALKLARFFTGRQGIVAFAPSFHGRTLGALSLTASSVHYRRRYAPLLPSVHHAPYPYCYRCAFGQNPGACGLECYEHLEWIFQHLVDPEEVACFVVEPVLGEGGYVVPPKEFVRNLKTLCERWGILLVFDEVQSGMGRTGRWFAAEHFGVVPDIMTLAKGIASGMPLSALISRAEIMGEWSPGAHGTTFGGNPVACAAAVATVQVIEEERLLENARAVGGYAMERLAAMKERHRGIGDVRGLGLMIGVEFVERGKRPAAQTLARILKKCLARGLILVECGSDKSVLRLAPPLNVQEPEMARALDIIEDAVARAGKQGE